MTFEIAFSCRPPSVALVGGCISGWLREGHVMLASSLVSSQPPPVTPFKPEAHISSTIYSFSASKWLAESGSQE